MKKLFPFFLTGIFFGIVMYKSEAISWFRIQEMFRFDSFHMYGIIGSALGCGLLIMQAAKRGIIRDINSENIIAKNKDKGVYRYLFGGTIFGMGWALTGACPGPLYILLGSGYSVFIVVILSAMLGVLSYGLLKDKLPH